MSGETLYTMWAVAMENQGVEVDGWADIGDVEQSAWQEVATTLAETRPS